MFHLMPKSTSCAAASAVGTPTQGIYLDSCGQDKCRHCQSLTFTHPNVKIGFAGITQSAVFAVTCIYDREKVS